MAYRPGNTKIGLRPPSICLWRDREAGRTRRLDRAAGLIGGSPRGEGTGLQPGESSGSGVAGLSALITTALPDSAVQALFAPSGLE